MNMIADVGAATKTIGWGRSHPRIAGSEAGGNPSPACSATAPVNSIPPRKIRRGYSEADDRRILAGVAAGERFEDIANALGRVPGSVYTRWRLIQSDGFDRGERREHGAPWTVKDEENLLRLHLSGWTYRAIQREHMPHRTIEAMRMRFSVLRKAVDDDDLMAGGLGSNEDSEEQWLENAKRSNQKMLERLAAYFARGGGI